MSDQTSQSLAPSPPLFFDTVNAYQRTAVLRAAIEWRTANGQFGDRDVERRHRAGCRRIGKNRKLGGRRTEADSGRKPMLS